MYLLIRYPVGIIVEAVVLATGNRRLRVAATGFADAIDLKRFGRQWFTDAGEPVEFDFLLSGGLSPQIVSEPLCAALAG